MDFENKNDPNLSSTQPGRAPTNPPATPGGRPQQGGTGGTDRSGEMDAAGGGRKPGAEPSRSSGSSTSNDPFGRPKKSDPDMDTDGDASGDDTETGMPGRSKQGGS